jgi:hypothetical protein
VLIKWIDRFVQQSTPRRVRVGRWLKRKAMPDDYRARVERLAKRGSELLVESGALWLVFGALEGYRDRKPRESDYWSIVVGVGVGLIVFGWVLEYLTVDPKKDGE